MTLLELTEPVFQYICRLNRLARRSGPASGHGDTGFFTKNPGVASPVSRGASMEYSVVRAEVKALLDEFIQKSAGDVRLSAQAKKMELPLMFFVDSLIAESALPFASQWNQNRLAYDRNELAGDEKFFDLLEETMKDPGEEASERLAAFYTCIGLGFSGVNFRQPEFLRKTMLTIAPRIRLWMEADQSAKICPETYEKIDTRNLVQPPGSRLALVGIIFLCFIAASLVSYALLYHSAAGTLTDALTQILTNNPGLGPVAK